MSFNTVTPRQGIQTGSAQIVIAGAGKSKWFVANTSLQTVNTNVLLNLGHATAYTTVIPIEVGNGVTRCWIRGVVPATATTFTTDPVVKLVASDGEVGDGTGIPWRIDTDDQDAAGITIDFAASTTVFTASVGGVSSYCTDVLGGSSGYDLRGARYLYVLVSTAAVITDGASDVTAAAYVLFGN